MNKILVFWLIIISSQTFADQDNKFLKEEEWPVTCDAAVDWLIENLEEESKTIVKETPKEKLIIFHLNLGEGHQK